MCLAFLTALIAVIIAYGAIGATIIGLLGPVFIPWMVFGKTEFLFWGWLKAFLGFEFYKVVAAATLNIISHLLITLFDQWSDECRYTPKMLIAIMPALVMLCFIAGFILLKIPAMTATLFSGHTGGHDAGFGVATALAVRGLIS